MKTILMIGLIVVIVIFFSIGCRRGFIREGATYTDFYRDLKQCEAENEELVYFLNKWLVKDSIQQISKGRHKSWIPLFLYAEPMKTGVSWRAMTPWRIPVLIISAVTPFSSRMASVSSSENMEA